MNLAEYIAGLARELGLSAEVVDLLSDSANVTGPADVSREGGKQKWDAKNQLSQKCSDRTEMEVSGASSPYYLMAQELVESLKKNGKRKHSQRD